MAEERRDIRPETIGKVLGLQTKPGGNISEVKKQADDMSVIDQTMGTAKKLAGTDALETQLTHKDEQLAKAGEEKDKLKDELGAAQIALIKGELGGKIDALSESMKKGASPGSISEQINEVKKAADSLGLGASKFSDLKDMMNLITSLNPQKNLAEQLKEAKELLAMLEPEKKKEVEGTLDGMPASIALEVTKINSNLQIQLAKMADERQARDQEFTLRVKGWEEDRDIRRRQVDGEIQVGRERNAIMANTLKIIGGAAGKGFADSMAQGPGGIAGQPGGQSGGQSGEKQAYHITLGEGEMGTTECPFCQTPIGVGPEQTSAECVGCHSQFEVKRTSAPPAEPISE